METRMSMPKKAPSRLAKSCGKFAPNTSSAERPFCQKELSVGCSGADGFPLFWALLALRHTAGG